MKKLFLLVFLSIFVLTSCGEEEVTVSGLKTKWWTTTTKPKTEIKDQWPANVGAAWLGGGGGGGGGGAPKAVDKKLAYKAHNTSADCFTQINKKTYNLTDIISQFPDFNDQLISMCGEETTDFYNTKLSWNADLVSAIEGSEVQ